MINACYLINLTLSVALNGDTIQEKWSDKLSDYSVLRTFSCAIFSHQNEGNLELKARK